jgi:hypothetical protein
MIWLLRYRRSWLIFDCIQSILWDVGSINFPWSFSPDIMHILFENIMKQLLSLWEGHFKATQVHSEGTGTLGGLPNEDYVIPEDVWTVMNDEVSKSNEFGPSQISRRLSSVTIRAYWTADTYSYFLTHLGPILLKDRLPRKYYEHFLLLSKMARIMIQTEITEEDLTDLDKGLVKWVRQFEK